MNRLLSAIAITTAILAPVAAESASRAAYTPAALAAAQAANKPILVEVNAWWCPVCASQSRSVEAALADPANRDLVVLRINYDRQRDYWRALGARRQGTLIAFRGRQEVGRLDFITDRNAINQLIARAVSGS